MKEELIGINFEDLDSQKFRAISLKTVVKGAIPGKPAIPGRSYTIYLFQAMFGKGPLKVCFLEVENGVIQEIKNSEDLEICVTKDATKCI